MSNLSTKAAAAAAAAVRSGGRGGGGGAAQPLPARLAEEYRGERRAPAHGAAISSHLSRLGGWLCSGQRAQLAAQQAS